MTRVVLLAGGRGERMRGLGDTPKPLVRIGVQSLIEHVMASFAAAGFDDFLIALGHRGNEIQAYLDQQDLPYKIQFRDTGDATQSGGRLARLRADLSPEPFLMAWCDGVFALDLADLLLARERAGKTCVMVAVEPVLPYGLLTLAGDQVVGLQEKPVLKDMWISAGIFALHPRVLLDIEGDEASWETDVLPSLARRNQLAVYRHTGFWKSVDTPKDVAELAGYGLPDGPGGDRS